MARRQLAQLELEHLGDPPEPPPPPRPARARPAPPWPVRLRFALVLVAGSVAVLLLVVALHQFDRLLAGAPRLALLANAPERFRIEGLVHGSRAELARVFAADFGRSIYTIPLGERRRQLMRVDWVREAAVSRRWPDRLLVRVVERTPVAFALMPAEVALIDAEGVILKLPARADFPLPVLSGVRREQPPAVRRERVGAMLQLLDELEAYAPRISEIDVSDPQDSKITQTLEGRAIRLRLGGSHFLSRVENFYAHYPEISRRLPETTEFDLRLGDQITGARQTAPPPRTGRPAPRAKRRQP